MIELTDTSYILALWFVSYDEANWMCAAYRETPEAAWTVRYRFRYFRDARVFDSDDRRHWFGIKVDPTEPEDALLEMLSRLADFVAVARGARVERLVVRGGMHDLIEKGKDSEWFHSMHVDASPR